MPNYTLDLISASAIKDDISPLDGIKDLWRVTSSGTLVAYCVDKKLADRIAHGNLYRSTVNPRGTLFSYPSVGSVEALCVGITNAMLHEDDDRRDRS